MNLNKICNKLIRGYYDKWCPVVAENADHLWGKIEGGPKTFPWGK